MSSVMQPVHVRPNSVEARDQAYVLHPMANLQRLADIGSMVVTEGSGVQVTDSRGRHYIEAVSGLWSITLGFGQERLAKAAYRQMQRLPSYHMFGLRTHEPAVDLAERLIAVAPVPMSKVFFANSGSEANDTAVKVARYYHNAIGRTSKKKIISRIGGYHGITIAAGSLTGLQRFHNDFDLPIPGVLHAGCPHYWRGAQDGETEEAFATRMADALEQMIIREGPDTIAAFIAEPVMGSGGIIVPPATYFEKIQAVLERYDVLFIVDEVITGFGRLGTYFGSEQFNLKPDMISLAKGLSSGYLPISALLINEKIYRVLLQQSGKLGLFGHGFTYSGHPVCAAVALEALKIYEEIDIAARVREVSPVLLEGLRKFADHPLVGEVRGMGLMAGAEIVRDKKTKESFDPALGVCAYLEERCAEHGVLVRAIAQTLAISPPLTISREELTIVVDAFGRALQDTYAHVREKGYLSPTH